MEILLVVAMVLAVGFGSAEMAATTGQAQTDAETVATAAPSAPSGGFVAEDQTPTGKFTTAAEVKQILEMTKPQWVAVRNFNGQDLLYFTNLLAWRCGTLQISYAVNGGPLEVLETEPCYLDTASPNAMKVEDIMPFVPLPADSVDTVEVHVLFDDLSESSAAYERADIMMN